MITIIKFLSNSMCLERVNLVGVFTTDTNEAWSTIRREQTVDTIPLHNHGCLLSRIQHFIIYGEICPFTPDALNLLSTGTLIIAKVRVLRFLNTLGYGKRTRRGFGLDYTLDRYDSILFYTSHTNRSAYKIVVNQIKDKEVRGG